VFQPSPNSRRARGPAGHISSTSSISCAPCRSRRRAELRQADYKTVIACEATKAGRTIKRIAVAFEAAERGWSPSRCVSDSLLEGDGFEPSVPPSTRRPLRGDPRPTTDVSRDDLGLMIPSSLSVRHLRSAEPREPFRRAVPMVRIRFPPAVSLRTIGSRNTKSSVTEPPPGATPICVRPAKLKERGEVKARGALRHALAATPSTGPTTAHSHTTLRHRRTPDRPHHEQRRRRPSRTRASTRAGPRAELLALVIKVLKLIAALALSLPAGTAPDARAGTATRS